jgi:hypothetical protein
MRTEAAKLLLILPGAIFGATIGTFLLAEWARLVLLHRHGTVFVFHVPWSGIGVGWYPRTTFGYAWTAFGNGMVLFGLATALVLCWTLEATPGQARIPWLLPVAYALLIAVIVVRPGLW